MTTTPPASATSPRPSPASEPIARARPGAGPLSAAELRALASRPAPAAKPVTSFRAHLLAGAPEDRAAPIERGVAPRALAIEEEPEPRPRRPRPLGDRREDEVAPAGLEPFRPPSPILAPAPHARVPSGSVDRAEAAALAERLVLAMRVGRVGRDGHVIQLRIRGPGGADLDVRLRHEDGRLGIVLAAHDAAGMGEARRISDVLRRELAARGVSLDALEVEDAR